jgi:hypothetical protein
LAVITLITLSSTLGQNHDESVTETHLHVEVTPVYSEVANLCRLGVVMDQKRGCFKQSRDAQALSPEASRMVDCPIPVRTDRHHL